MFGFSFPQAMSAKESAKSEDRMRVFIRAGFSGQFAPTCGKQPRKPSIRQVLIRKFHFILDLVMLVG